MQGKPTQMFPLDTVTSWASAEDSRWTPELVTRVATGQVPGYRIHDEYYQIGDGILGIRLDLNGANAWRRLLQLEEISDEIEDKRVYSLTEMADIVGMTRAWFYRTDNSSWELVRPGDEELVSVAQARDWFGRKNFEGLPARGRYKVSELAYLSGVDIEELKEFAIEHENDIGATVVTKESFLAWINERSRKVVEDNLEEKLATA